MDKRFIGAFTDPAGISLLGRRLYPFCLKHRVRLMAIDSPFMTGDDCSPLDLLLAIQICAEEPIGKLTLTDRMRLLKYVKRDGRFTADVDKFVAYLNINNWPKFWEKNKAKSGGDSGMPWILTIISTLISGGIDEQRAWEMPECQAIWLSSAMSVSKGADINILTTEDEEAMQEMRSLAVANPSDLKPDKENGTQSGT